MDVVEGQHGTLTLLPIDGNLELVEEQWLYLQAQFPHSFFTSWGWMRTWLECHSPHANIHCVIGYRDDRPRFIFFLGLHRYRKNGILPTRSAHLNATGKRELDGITIEYNNILGDVHFDRLIPLLSELKALRRCEEFVFPGAEAEFARTVSRSSQSFFFTSNQQPSYYVDLSLVREKDGDFLQLLSANKRQQIRRTLREYEQAGPVEHRSAASTEEALAMFDDMGILHSATWRKRGKNGSFTNPAWVRFHKSLIQARFAHGEIHTSRIFNRGGTLGYIYGFVYNNSFLFCQCGFNYERSNKKRPGLLSHYLLIKHFAEQGLESYDFLAGDGDYKQSLSTHQTSISWVALQRRKTPLRVAKALKTLAMKGRRLLRPAH
jgi:hypothetical protein